MLTDQSEQMIVNKIHSDPKLSIPKIHSEVESVAGRKLSKMCYAGMTIMAEWLERNPSSVSVIVKRDLNLPKCISTCPKSFGTTPFEATPTRVNSTSLDRTGANWF
jgi:hypothetical protein